MLSTLYTEPPAGRDSGAYIETGQTSHCSLCVSFFDGRRYTNSASGDMPPATSEHLSVITAVGGYHGFWRKQMKIRVSRRAPLLQIFKIGMSIRYQDALACLAACAGHGRDIKCLGGLPSLPHGRQHKPVRYKVDRFPDVSVQTSFPPLQTFLMPAQQYSLGGTVSSLNKTCITARG
jgi:hypothetical protein